jgi:hypothetical protein
MALYEFDIEEVSRDGEIAYDAVERTTGHRIPVRLAPALTQPVGFPDIEDHLAKHHGFKGKLIGPVAKFWRLRLVEQAGGIGASELEVAHGPERPCREAQAPGQGRFQGPAL